jgi:hypothetical protein
LSISAFIGFFSLRKSNIVKEKLDELNRASTITSANKLSIKALNDKLFTYQVLYMIFIPLAMTLVITIFFTIDVYPNIADVHCVDNAKRDISSSPAVV